MTKRNLLVPRIVRDNLSLQDVQGLKGMSLEY